MKKFIIIGLLLILFGTTAYTTGFVIMVSRAEPPKPVLHPHTVSTEEYAVYTKFIIRAENGILVVYEENGELYDITGIRLSELSRELQIKVLNGYMADSAEQLYRILENYSS